MVRTARFLLRPRQKAVWRPPGSRRARPRLTRIAGHRGLAPLLEGTDLFCLFRDRERQKAVRGPSAMESDASRYAWKESRRAGNNTFPILNRKAGTEGEFLTAPKSSISAWSAPCSSRRRLGKRSSNTRFRKASAVSALCQMKRLVPS